MATTQTFDVFNPEVWGAKLNRAFEANLVAAKFFSNYSNDIAEGVISYGFPQFLTALLVLPLTLLLVILPIPLYQIPRLH
jgi:hypothetical protein